MRTGTVSYKLEDLRKGVIIPIGMVGENDFTRVIFDAEEVFKKHPDAQVTMKVQPPKGGIYPATVNRDGNAVIWQVKASDVAHRGSGELQLTFTADTMVEKSYIARTDIKRSLIGNGPAPDPVQDWVDNAEEVLEDLEEAEVHQPTIGTDGYWYKWNQETGEYEKTDTKAQGTDGHSPVLTSSKSGKTTTIYADGTQLAQIQDGEDGQGADVIDDTAGEGDTNKTWSANKLDEELTDVKTAISGVEDKLDDLADKITYSGYVAKNGTVNSNSNDTKRTTYLPVKANDLYYYDLRGIDNFSIIAFFTSNDASTFVADNRVVGNGSDTHKTGIYTIPQNGYIIITSMNSYADHAVFAKVGSLPSVENRLYQAENEIDTFDAYFVNFADKITVTGYVASNGSVISSSSDTKRTTYLPVKSGEKFYYNLLGIDNFRVVAFFSSDKTYVSGVLGSTGIASIGVATAPQDGFVIFTSMNKYAGTACACYYDSFRRVQSIVNNDVMLPDLTGRNILNFGDSLANGAGWGNKSYADLIATETGATLIDCSGSGNAFARLTNSDGYGCVVNQVKNAIVTYAESDVPIIFVEGGINDLKQDTFTIGDMTYSYEGSTSLWGTLIGACDYIFYSLRNTFPSAKIVFVMYHHMPIQNTEAGLSYEDIDERQDQQHEAFLKVCAKWGIPVADVYAEGQLNAQMEEMAKLYFNTNANEKWGRDIAHPNGLGYKRFYVPLIRKKLQQSNG